jgi:hypothetical protein
MAVSFIGGRNRSTRRKPPTRQTLSHNIVPSTGEDPGFQVRGGGHLKKLRRAKGGAKIFWVFRVKNHDFTPKIIFFPILGGRAPGAPPTWILPWSIPHFERDSNSQLLVVIGTDSTYDNYHDALPSANPPLNRKKNVLK